VATSRARGLVPAASARRHERVAEHLEALLGDGREEGLLVAEVSVRRRVAHADPRRELAQGDAPGALARDPRDRRVDQRPPQVAVVVSPLPGNAPGHVTTVIIRLPRRRRNRTTRSGPPPFMATPRAPV
jgi:hypothetical protein